MDLNDLKQEPGLTQFIEIEPALFVKEEILEVSKQDGNEQQYVQDTSKSAGTGSMKEVCSKSLDNLLNVKCELVDMEVGPTLLQPMDIPYIINKNTNAEHTEENTIVYDNDNPRPCSGIKKNIEDNLRVAADITYKCDKCLRAFKSNVKLKYHQQRMHGIESHRCTECKKEFKCREYLRNHLNYTHSKFQFECSICRIMCKTRRILTKHHSRMHKTAVATMEYVASEPVMDRAHMEITIKTEVEKAALSTAYIDNESNVNHLKQEPGLVQFVNSEPPSLVKEGRIEDSGQVSYKQKEVEMKDSSVCRALESLKLGIHKDRLNSTCRVHLKRLDTFQCDLCEAVYIENCSSLQHLQSVHRSYPKTSLFAKYDKTNKQQCDADRKNRNYSCDKCLKTFLCKSGLKSYCQVVHGKKYYKCPKCNREFKCMRYLRSHINNMHGNRQYECDICKKIFKYRKSISEHIVGYHSHLVSGKQHQRHRCDKCLKAFKSKFLRNKHWTRMHGSESHKCTQCNKEFKCKTYLVSHVRHIHSKEKYECDICEKTYSTPGALRLHVSRFHHNRSTEEKYCCDKCMKTFPFKIALKAHSLKMHGTECYKCAECNREFKCMSYLRYHINYMHSKKQYECEICKKIFKFKRNLTGHIVGRHSHLVSGADEQQNVPVTSTRAIADSASVAAESAERVQLLQIKEELDIGPTMLQHMDSYYRNNQQTVQNEPDLSMQEDIAGA